MKITLLTLLFSLIMLVACQTDSTEVAPTNLTTNSTSDRMKNEEKTFTHIDKGAEDVITILKEKYFQDLISENKLDLENLTVVKFSKRKGSSLLLIPIKSTKTTSNNVIFVNFNTEKRLGKILLMETEGSISGDVFSGINRIKTVENKVLREEFISENRLSKTVVFNGVSDELSLTNKNAKDRECSYDEFNYYYGIFKNNCSKDAICDIACTAAGPMCAAGMALQALDYCWAYDYNP